MIVHVYMTVLCNVCVCECTLYTAYVCELLHDLSLIIIIIIVNDLYLE